MYPLGVAVSFGLLEACGGVLGPWPIFCVAGVLAGCGGSATSWTAVTATTSGDPACQGVLLRFDSAGIHDEGKPTASYVFDVQLVNPAGEPRWVVFPEALPREGRDEPGPGRGEIQRITADRLGGTGRLIAVHATGPGGFRAFYLPAKAKVRMHELPISADWTAFHATVRVEVILARELTVDEAPIASLVQGSLLADPESDTSFEGDFLDSLQVKKSLTSGSPHTITIEEDCRVTAQTILKHQEP